MKIDHVAACPEISPTDCASHDIPDHMHHQTIRWFRNSLTTSIGLGQGWQTQVNIPLDIKILGIEYSLDGEPYEPSYAGIHHREENLVGLADPMLSIQRYQGLPADFVLGLSLGSSIPLGKTEADPFALAAQGKEHQHFQRGTGSFVPSGRLELFWMGLRWRAIAVVMGQQPLYESSHGYTPSASISYGLTGGYRLKPETQLLVSVLAQHDGPDAWNGDTSNSSARDMIMSGVGATHVLSDRLTLQSQLRGTLWQHTASSHDEDQLVQRFLFTLGMSWSPKKDNGAS
jgi:hypothetical protein